MDNTHLARISITPTVARQTPKNDFGQVLNNSLSGVLRAGSVVGGLTGMPIVSSAVSAVSSLVNSPSSVRSSAAASGVVNLTGGSSSSGSGNAASSMAVGSTLAGGRWADPAQPRASSRRE